MHFDFERARFAEHVRRRELPGSARREAQEQAEFEAAREFYAQFTDTPPSFAASEEEQWPESQSESWSEAESAAA